jgi:uncharacterized protein
MNATAHLPASISQDARRRFMAREERPLLKGDWTRALFLHYEMPAELLQTHIPFDLDLWEGKAFVSAVAFSMEGLRPNFGGALGRWLFRPIANTEFFNLRTYVWQDGVPGIFFISEWLNNRCSVMGGPVTYGLPYNFARIQYQHFPDQGRLAGRVGDDFAYTAKIANGVSFQACGADSLDEFLIERYTAFTRHRRHSRYFDIWHEPWRQARVRANIRDDSLLRRNFPWFDEAQNVGANYSPGVRDVWMGAPRPICHMSPQMIYERR